MPICLAKLGLLKVHGPGIGNRATMRGPSSCPSSCADDRSCAVSATGDGEAFILSVFAHEVDALVRLAGLDLGAACQRALHEVGAGTGGCIAVGPDGTVAMPFTSAHRSGAG